MTLGILVLAFRGLALDAFALRVVFQLRVPKFFLFLFLFFLQFLATLLAVVLVRPHFFSSDADSGRHESIIARNASWR